MFRYKKNGKTIHLNGFFQWDANGSNFITVDAPSGVLFPTDGSAWGICGHETYFGTYHMYKIQGFVNVLKIYANNQTGNGEYYFNVTLEIQ